MKPKPKFQPSIYVAREDGETPTAFMQRILKDPRLLPDQRATLERDTPSRHDHLVRGVWIERAPKVTAFDAGVANEGK